MFSKIFNVIFGSKNNRVLKKYNTILIKINSLSNLYSKLNDEELKQKFLSIKKNFLNDNLNINVYDEILPHVYAIVREVSYRVLKLRHYDVQILGGIALFQNKIIEVATGEGKTLIATLPACLFSLYKKPVHIVTVNDYLAKRDALWMKPIYDFLSIKVGIISSNMSILERKKSYSSDIVYGTCTEFGFDYLRDNIVLNKDDKTQTGLFYAILDEVDSILIDEARTPLIISSPEKFDCKSYYKVYKISKLLKKDCDFIIDEKNKNVQLTDIGFANLEKIFKKYQFLNETNTLYDINNINLLHDIYASLKASYLFKKDVDYIVKDDSILIIDENTGRIMDGRRWSDGIHQALEAKENVNIKNENQTLASITFQNYFRLYKSICGMTGTAYTESEEFNNIYGLDVIVIPTNKKCIRIDESDLVFFNKKLKFNAIIDDISKCYAIGQPILVGTTSIEVSEFLSNLLSKKGIKHNVLNAKNHEKESEIVSEAGKIKTVTIATNMAGRGTDIVLGGKCFNDIAYNTVIKLGGLRVLGTERHESRRIDNQLRGRCGRQGDPGSTQFYLSLEDDLIRLFIGEKINFLLHKLKVSNDVISHDLINKSIENAQKKVESHNYDIRKQLLEFDDIFNEQRVFFYKYRDLLIFEDDISSILKFIISDVIEYFFIKNNYVSDVLNELDIDDLNNKFFLEFGIKLENNNDVELKNFKKKCFDYLYDFYNIKRLKYDKDIILNFEKMLFLNILDVKWKDHLSNLDYLRKGIYLRGYAQQDPKNEYKKESFYLFENMLYLSKYEFVVLFLHFPLDSLIKKDINLNDDQDNDKLIFDKNSLFNNKKRKIGRNELCYCNSGKKYKQCHG